MILKNENGYALYIVMGVSFLLFLVLSYTITLFVQQARMIELREDYVRCQVLIQSALPLWFMAAKNGQYPERLELTDGNVFIHNIGESEASWNIQVLAVVTDSKVKDRIEVEILKDSGAIVKWQDVY